jgi:hypothetical protein
VLLVESIGSHEVIFAALLAQSGRCVVNPSTPGRAHLHGWGKTDVLDATRMDRGALDFSVPLPRVHRARVIPTFSTIGMGINPGW